MRTRLTTLLVIALIALLPTQLGKHFFFPFSFVSGVRIDYLAPTLYLTDLIALALVVLNAQLVWKSFHKKEFALVAGLGVINLLLAISPAVAAYRFLKIIEIYTLYVIIRQAKMSAQSVLAAFTVGAAFEWALATMQFVTRRSLQGVFYWLGERYFNMYTPDIAKITFNGVQFLRPYGSFSHPNSMAGFYLLVYTFVLTAPYFKKHFILKNLLILFSSILILLSCSKIAIAAFAVLSIYYITRRGVITCRLCRYGRSIVLTVVSLIFLSGHGDPMTIDKRLTLMSNALDIIGQRPLFGTGLGNYILAQAQFPIRQSYFFLQPVHNIYLLFLTESGLLLAIGIIYTVWKRIKITHYYPHFLIPVAAIAVTGLADHYWITLQQNWMLLPVIFALPVALKKEKSSDTVKL